MLRLLTVLLALFVSACSTGNLTAIHKRTGLGETAGEAQGVFIDAEQRAIISGTRPARKDWRLDPNGTYQWVEVEGERLIVCAEPSPDALSAIAAQAGVSLSDVSRALTAQGGISETAASIGLRTQTIQILRDGFYRLCEAQLNGLPDVQYAIMLRRFQTNMIALLAIEQLTGAVKGSDAIVSASAGSALNMKEVYLQRVAQASAELGQIELDLAADEKELAGLKELDGKCKDEDTATSGCGVTDREARKKEILRVESDIETLKRRKVNAQANKDANTQLAETAPAALPGAGGGLLISPLPGGGSSRSVADAVSEIALALIRQDYGTQICLEYLKEGLAPNSDILASCKGVVEGYAKQFSDRSNSRAKYEARMDKVWDAFLKDGEIDEDELQIMAALTGAQVSDTAIVKTAGPAFNFPPGFLFDGSSVAALLSHQAPWGISDEQRSAWEAYLNESQER